MFTPIHHQFTLFDYNQMRPAGKIPIKRISKARMEQAMYEMRKNPDRCLKCFGVSMMTLTDMKND
jgi:hypothetical protein